jgi:hypothetical protein
VRTRGRGAGPDGCIGILWNWNRVEALHLSLDVALPERDVIHGHLQIGVSKRLHDGDWDGDHLNLIFPVYFKLMTRFPIVCPAEDAEEVLQCIRGDRGHRSTTAIGFVFNQPNLKESTSGLVITGSWGDSPLGDVVSHLGKSGGGRESRNYENLLFIINLFQLDELALYMQCTLANFPTEEKK